MYTDQLQIPDGVLSDPEAFEIMRLWAAHEALHVTLNSDLSGGAADFGELLSDLSSMPPACSPSEMASRLNTAGR